MNFFTEWAEALLHDRGRAGAINAGVPVAYADYYYTLGAGAVPGAGAGAVLLPAVAPAPSSAPAPTHSFTEHTVSPSSDVYVSLLTSTFAS